MTPTRVGIIGLKGVVQEHYSPGTWGLQHLKALSASPHYDIVAVCNATVESAQNAIDVHKLQAKPYGSAEDLAADPNVDMVLISVDVSSRSKLMEPVLRHKKNVYIEFPAAPRAEEIKKLAEMSTKQGVKVVVGAQGIADPNFSKVRELITAGQIGDLVSTTLTGYIPIVTADGWPHAQIAFLDIDNGISRVRGVLGHILSIHQSVVGDFQHVQSALKVQDKFAKTLDAQNNVVDPAYPTTSPDTMFVQGVLTNGALASVCIRSLRPAADDTGFRWVISGTKGEIELTSPPGIMTGLPGVKIRMRNWGTDAEDVSVSQEDPSHIKSVTEPGTNVARTWEAFNEGAEDRFSSISDSVKVHELLEKIIDGAIYAP